jgi:UDP-N-acetyl-D-mannosaminuronic acid transferase (WecB/TagA/CpsF family)
MENTSSLTSHALFGVRVDSLTPAQVAVALWESVTSRRDLMVVLADVWTLLLAQRAYPVWEALVASDFVLPVEDDAVIRRLAARLHVPVAQPGLLLHDLCGAAAQTQKKVVFVGPEDELESDVALVQRIWPALKLSGVSRWSTIGAEADDVMVKKLNEQAADLLIVGGETFWQEDFMHTRRDALTTRVIVLLPTLHTALAGVAQHAGVPVSSIGRLRRKAAFQRAYSTTIAPAAEASAAAVGTWLEGARHGISDLSAAIQAQRPPAALRRLQRLRTPAERTVAVRVNEWRDPSESEIMRRLITSPLARMTPRVMPALPPPAPRPPVVIEDESDRWMADQPTVSLTLDAIRASIPPSLQQPVTGYWVDSSSRNPAPNGQSPAIPPSNAGVVPTPDSSLPGVARPGEANPAASGSGMRNPAASVPNGSSPASAVPGAPPPARDVSPSQLAPTTLLGRHRAPLEPPGARPPEAPEREPVPDALAPTTRLRPLPPRAPEPPVANSAGGHAGERENAPAPETPPASATPVDDPGVSQARVQVRIVRKYVVKRARRKTPRKRPTRRRPTP